MKPILITLLFLLVAAIPPDQDPSSIHQVEMIEKIKHYEKIWYYLKHHCECKCDKEMGE